MKKYLLYCLIIAMWCLTSCSSTWKVRRAKHLLESSNIPWKTDTVFSETKIVIPETKFDTVLKQVNFTDTIIITKDKVVTKVKVNTVEHTVYVSTKCPEKIITKRVPVIVNKEIKVGDSGWKNFRQIAPWSLLFLILGFCACYLLKLLRVIP